MSIRIHSVINITLSILLASVLFIGLIGSQKEYDHWCDVNDDGKIDVMDVFEVASRYGTTGTPINKTALLLELQTKVDSLNQTLETRMPKKGYISIPAAAFVSTDLNKTVSITSLLTHNEGTNVEFIGEVQFFHSSIVTNMTFYCGDVITANITCSLYRYNYTYGWGFGQLMAYTESSYGSTGAYYDDTIDYATVDNSQYTYYLLLDIPPGGLLSIAFQYAIIEYEHPE